MIAGRSRGEALGLFLALLELVRQRRLTVSAGGERSGVDAVLTLREPDDPEEPPEAAAPGATAPDPEDLDAFEWPDPAARTRHARRLRLRAARAEAPPEAQPQEEPDASA